MPKTLDFCISDNSVNRLGFRILTSGIHTENFEKNPVAMLAHNHETLPLGNGAILQKKLMASSPAH